jgi:hypothetical protein
MVFVMPSPPRCMHKKLAANYELILWQKNPKADTTTLLPDKIHNLNLILF